MTKILFFLLFCLFQATYGQTNIAVPRWNSQNLEFYLSGENAPTYTKNTGHGNNGVVFFGSDMFVAGGTGIDWYAGVSLNPYNLASISPTILNNSTATIQVAVDAAGNVYSANLNGSVTKFFRVANSYSITNSVSVRFGANSSQIMGGLSIDDVSGTIWVSNYSAQNIAVARLASFPSTGTAITPGRATFVKPIEPDGTISWLLGAIEGVAFIPNAGVWFASNWDMGTVSRISQNHVNAILGNDFSTVPSFPLQMNDVEYYQTNLGNQFGGLTYDNLYSKKLYINDQHTVNNKVVLTIDPFSDSPVSTFVATPYIQTYPGNGQAAIIPCALLPPFANPLASGTTINSGQTATLTASNCAADQTYRWKQAGNVVGNNASFTTPNLTLNTTYTSHCVRGGTCESSGLSVTVIVNEVLPFSVTATPTSVCAGLSVSLMASNCAGTVTWNIVPAQTDNIIYVYPSINTTYTATCSTGGSGSAAVTVIPSPPLTITSSMPSTISDCNATEVIYLHTGESTSLSATGCTGTVTWYDYPNSGTTFPLVISLTSLGAKYLNFSCLNTNGCNSNGFAAILNQFATDDAFSTPMNTFFSGNVLTNDTEQNIALGAYMATPPTNGTIIWTMSMGRPTGVFTYTPNTGFQGTDTFTYYDSDDLTCTKRATVTITVGNPCPTSIIIAQNTPLPTNYPANEIIKASDYINTISPPNIVISPTNSNNLTFQAGKAVNLTAGFSVSNGAVFTAKIGDCVTLPAHQTFYTQGKDIYAPNGQKIVFRGVNYPVLDDWDFPASDKITEVEKSKANSVRMQWWINYPGRPAFTNTDLDNLLTKCKNNKMIPILAIADYTCGEDMSVLNSAIVPWWTSPAVVSVLNNHKQYVIINLANELGKYRWGNIYSGSSYNIAALNAWKNAYKTAITSIRNAGLKMPIMIDGTDCGSDLKAFWQVGQEIIDHDPEHNIIFSGHAYWQYYPDQAADLNAVIAANIPLVFGEIANYQSETGANLCDYNLGDNVGYKYQDFLTYLQTNEMGWIAWAWVRDNCEFRNMTNNDNNNPATFGKFNTLTTYGQDIVNNMTYGIYTHSIRATIFP